MKKIELIARVFMKENGLSVPVDLEKVAEIAGVEIGYVDSDTRSAIYYNDEDTGDRFMLIGSRQPVEQQRFSLGHELAHDLLEHKGNALTGLGGYNKKNESFADDFAAELLMPKREVKKYAYKYNFDVRKLASIFVVSEKAMFYRMDKLGLEKENCRYNNSLKEKHDLCNSQPVFE